LIFHGAVQSPEGAECYPEGVSDYSSEPLVAVFSPVAQTIWRSGHRSAPMQARPADARVIGRELGVRYVMEGSVQGGGDRIRVNAQLIDTGTGAHLWAERFDKPRADIFDYRSHVARDSMLNTPPTWNWYLAGLVFKWMLAEGGVEEFARRNQAKSALVYAAIDGSGGFYRNDVVADARSRMNIPFFLPDDTLTARFVAESKAAGLLALKGHKAVGGIRASLYNAMPVAGAQALVAFMRDFQQRNG
jgi:hypothetical protein